jgi:hypothetical protein
MKKTLCITAFSLLVSLHVSAMRRAHNESLIISGRVSKQETSSCVTYSAVTVDGYAIVCTKYKNGTYRCIKCFEPAEIEIFQGMVENLPVSVFEELAQLFKNQLIAE